MHCVISCCAGMVFGQDGSFSYDALVGRYNSDLANGLGNLASRTLSMIHQYRDGVVPPVSGSDQIAHTADGVVAAALEEFNRFGAGKRLKSVWSLIATVDKFECVASAMGRAKAGSESSAQLDSTLYTAAEALRIVTALLYPVMPESAKKIWAQLGFETHVNQVRTSDLHWGHLPAGQKLAPVVGVFPRADPKIAIDQMQAGETVEYNRQQACSRASLHRQRPMLISPLMILQRSISV